MGDLRSLSPDELMMRLAKGSLNAADMVKLLGRNGTALIPTLRGIADGVIKIGKVVDNDMVARIDRADDALKRWSNTFKVDVVEYAQKSITDVARLKAGLLDLWGDVKGVFGGDIGADHTAALEEQLAAEKEKTAEQEKQAAVMREQAALQAEMIEAAEAQAAAAAAARDRVNLSLAELAKGPGFEGNVNMQAAWQTEQARMVQRLEAESKAQSLNADFVGAQRTMARADEIRSSIGGLKEAERDPARAVKDGLDSSERLRRIEENVTFKGN